MVVDRKIIQARVVENIWFKDVGVLQHYKELNEHRIEDLKIWSQNLDGSINAIVTLPYNHCPVWIDEEDLRVF